MEITERNVLYLASGFVLAFVIAAYGTSCALRKGPSAPSAERWSPAETAVFRALDTHPDPDIRGPFAEKLRSGGVVLRVAVPDEEEASASFGPKDGVYELTIDPARVTASAARDGMEDLWSILSHEHAHYRQYEEGEMRNYDRRGGTMTETACTLVVLVEIDAYAKACRDARAYGWTSSFAEGACARTNASIAGYFLRVRGRNYPECKPVWGHFADRDKDPPAARPATRKKPAPKTRSSGIYLAPP